MIMVMERGGLRLRYDFEFFFYFFGFCVGVKFYDSGREYGEIFSVGRRKS